MLIFSAHKPFKSLFLIFFVVSLQVQAQKEDVRRDARLDSLLEIKINMQKGHMLGENYTIQIHSGALADGQTLMTDFKNAFPQWPVIVHYETPNYKVWAGNFSERLSADQALKSIQRKFPSAFIFKPSLMRKEILTPDPQEQEITNPKASANRKSAKNEQ